MKKLLIVVCLFALAGVESTFAQQEKGDYYAEEELIEPASNRLEPSDMILGLWWSPQKDAQIKIYKEDGKYFGKIIWLNDPSLVDERNEDPELRGRPIMGIDLLKGFEYNSRKKEWAEGMVYEPYRGKFYDSYMKVDKRNSDKLKVRGFIMNTRFLGETETFTRVK